MLSIVAPMLSSCGRDPTSVYSGVHGERLPLLQVFHMHQDYLTVETELKTFSAELSTVTVPLLKEVSHQWRDLEFKACHPASLVP